MSESDKKSPLIEDLERAAAAVDFGEEGLRRLCGQAAERLEVAQSLLDRAKERGELTETERVSALLSAIEPNALAICELIAATGGSATHCVEMLRASLSHEGTTDHRAAGESAEAAVTASGMECGQQAPQGDVLAQNIARSEPPAVAALPSGPKQGETPRTDAADDPTMRFSERHNRLKVECGKLERELADAKAQITLDTGNIERIRAAGEKAERELAEERESTRIARVGRDQALTSRSSSAELEPGDNQAADARPRTWAHLAIAMLGELRMDYAPGTLHDRDGVKAVKKLRAERDALRSARAAYIEPTDAQIAAFEKSWTEITMPARGGRKRITDALKAMYCAADGRHQT